MNSFSPPNKIISSFHLPQSFSSDSSAQSALLSHTRWDSMQWPLSHTKSVTAGQLPGSTAPETWILNNEGGRKKGREKGKTERKNERNEQRKEKNNGRKEQDFHTILFFHWYPDSQNTGMTFCTFQNCMQTLGEGKKANLHYTHQSEGLWAVQLQTQTI